MPRTLPSGAGRCQSAPVQESPELAALVRRMYSAQAAGDVEWLSTLLSASDHALTIGTDPAEWWEGAQIRERWRAQLAAGMGEARMTATRLSAFEEGDVGWVADEPQVVLPDGTTLTMRATAVFHREAGAWRLVQGHSSLGVPNAVSFGRDLPT
jgi:ketosteroid isomerase-like protein